VYRFNEVVRKTPNPRITLVQRCGVNPRTGSFLVRVGMQGEAPPAVDMSDGAGGGRKRVRQAEQPSMLPQQQAPVDRKRFVNMREVLVNHYDTSEAHQEDVWPILAAVNSMLCLEAGMPMLPCKITRCNGFYTLTMTEFTEFIDMDKLYHLMFADPDPETLFGVTHVPLVEWVGINPHVTTVMARVTMKRAAQQQQQQHYHQQVSVPSAAKRGRRAIAPDDGDEYE
jgi:hypothetical protein